MAAMAGDRLRPACRLGRRGPADYPLRCSASTFPLELPTEQFLSSGAGRVVDIGAGSGRAAVGLLLARPRVTVTAVDI